MKVETMLSDDLAEWQQINVKQKGTKYRALRYTMRYSDSVGSILTYPNKLLSIR